MLKLVFYVLTQVSSPSPIIFHYVSSVDFISDFFSIVLNKFSKNIAKLTKEGKYYEKIPFDIDKFLF
jgi:hypothetical protein